MFSIRECKLTRLINTVLVCVLLMGAMMSVVNADIYRWVDDKGRVHFGDKAETQKQPNKPVEKVEVKIADSQWQRFDISVTSVDVSITAEETQRIIRDVNNVYAFYDEVMYFDFYKTVPVSITILKDKAGYNRYLQKVIGKTYGSSRGVYLLKTNEIVVYMRSNRNGTFETIKHETSHAIVDSIAEYTPGWLNEGLAEQMEKIERNEGRLVIHRHQENQQIIKNKSTMLALRKMLDLHNAQWRKNNISSNSYLQAQAGELLFYLLSSSPRKSFVVRILQEYKRGSRTRSLYLVRDNYIGDIGGMETGWEIWLRQKNSEPIAF